MLGVHNQQIWTGGVGGGGGFQMYSDSAPQNQLVENTEPDYLNVEQAISLSAESSEEMIWLLTVSKLDLLKGNRQVPLTSRASDIAAFVTPDSFIQFSVMAFGMRSARHLSEAH